MSRTRTFPYILNRYIFTEILGAFTICLLAFTGVLLTLRLLQFTALIVNKHVALSQIALVFASLIPTFLEIAMPLATLLGVMLAYARMSGDSEIVVMRASGISAGQLLTPALLFGGVAVVATVLISHFGKPAGFRTLNRTFFEIAKARSTAGLSSGVFNKLGSLILYAEEIKDQNGTLTKVLIEDKRIEDQRQIIVAQRGRIVSDVESETIIFLLEDGYIHQNIEGKYIVTKFDTNQIVLESQEMSTTEETQKGRRARELYSKELIDSIDALNLYLEPGALTPKEVDLIPLVRIQMRGKEVNQQTLQKKLTQLRVERTFRYAVPFSCILLACLAVPLGISPPRLQRTWGAGLSTVLGTGVFVIYYALLSVGITLSESLAIHPILGVWLPNVVLLVASLVLFRGMTSGKRDSVAEWIEGWISRFRRT